MNMSGKKMCGLMLVFVLWLSGASWLTAQNAPTEPTRFQFDVEPVNPDKSKTPGSDLITPMNSQPLNIDEALDKRLKIMGRPAKNAILVVGDGMDAAAIRLARDVLVGPEKRLYLDQLPVIGRMISIPADGSVSDSPSAATALATGKPGLLKKISLDKDGRALTTLFEFAKQQKFRVGLVTDTRVTHATPAAFGAHVAERDEEATIAQHLIENEFHVLLGGGRKFFLPQDKGGARTDGSNMLDKAILRGFTVVGSKKELAETTSKRADKVLGLFGYSFIPYSWEKESPEQPTLAEMSAAALTLLGASGNRFVLMVEAGRIDIANHARDAAELVNQMKALDDAMAVLIDYVKAQPDTLLVVVSDHATGNWGLTNHFSAETFRRTATSTMALCRSVKHNKEAALELVKTAFPGIELTKAELDKLAAVTEKYDLEAILGQMLFRKLGLDSLDYDLEKGYKAAAGHTGEDLFVHAMGAHQNLFGGVMNIWDIPEKMAAALGLAFP
jgi:alkaline phosphatase